jgi:hypothetical protein
VEETEEVNHPIHILEDKVGVVEDLHPFHQQFYLEAQELKDITEEYLDLMAVVIVLVVVAVFLLLEEQVIHPQMVEQVEQVLHILP